jgi:hypothetical protein
MRIVIAYEYLTLDGVMEAPEYWRFPYLAAAWPECTQNEFGMANKLNSMPKYIVSRL